MVIAVPLKKAIYIWIRPEIERLKWKKSFNPGLSKRGQEVLFSYNTQNQCNIPHFATIQDFLKLILKTRKYYIWF